MQRGNSVESRGADPEEVERGGHRVRGELPPARACARACGALELVQVIVAHLPDGVGADGLEDVLDCDVAPAETPRRDRAVVERETGKVEARERHDRGGNRLVAADEADEAVEEVPARHELDRVGDHLA